MAQSSLWPLGFSVCLTFDVLNPGHTCCQIPGDSVCVLRGCRALEIASEVARSAPLSLRMAKASINHGMDVDLATGLSMVGHGHGQGAVTS